MHESQLARRVLDVVLTHADRAKASRVRTVVGRLAELEPLDPEAIRFHFAAHARGTLAENAELELELDHVEARCDACGRDYLPDHVTLCPECGHVGATLLAPVGLFIESVEIEPL